MAKARQESRSLSSTSRAFIVCRAHCGANDAGVSQRVRTDAARTQNHQTLTQNAGVCTPFVRRHIWDVKLNAPCDLRQYAALCGLLCCLPALRVAAETVTPSQMRSLLGQGTHASAVARILDRCRARMGDAKWFEMRTFASLGSGNSSACNAHLIASPTVKRVCL